MRLSIHLRAFALAIPSVILLTVTASAAEVRVMISGGLTAAYKALVPEFERATGHKVLTAYGPSMGTTTNAIPVRLDRGEAADVLIMVGYALDDLVKNGKAIADSKVDLVKSPIAVAVKSGTPKPDISTPDALKRALLAVKTDRLFGQRQRRLCLDRDVRQARHCRRNEGQGEENSGHPGRRDRRARRRRDRLPADQRIEAGGRHRHRRPAAGRVAEDHGVLRRHRHASRKSPMPARR